MQTEILIISGVVLFLVILISLATNYFKIYEGLVSSNPTPPPVIKPNFQPTITAQQINDTSNALLNSLNMGSNKADYEDIVNALLQYYDNLSVYTIINSTLQKDSTYNIQSLYTHKIIRDALNDSLEYIKSA